MSQAWANVRLRFADAARALLLRPARHVARPASVLEMLILLALYLALAMTADFLQIAGDKGELRFSWWLLQWPLCLFATMLWFGWLLERASLQVVTSDQGVEELVTETQLQEQRPSLSTSGAFATALAAALLIDCLAQLLMVVFEMPPWFEYLPSAWWLISMACLAWNSMRTQGVWRATRWITLAVALAPLLFALALALRYPMGAYFYRELAQLTPLDRLASEEIWTLQSKLLNTRLAAIQASRSNTPEFYFLAFAPDAREDVFLRETAVIQTLMDSRFDTQGRSLRLVNHASQYRTHPAATVAHLRQALNHFGKTLDPNKDVLVLYLTAHGSRSHDLIAHADAMQLKNLRPEVLDQMLKAAGIRHAVIAVSACFSGGWIPALENADRLVMTAASATNTSFGCGSESEFTYWGRAVFDEGLRASFSFEQAFERALPVLKKREAEAGHPWSDPQIRVGEAIRPLLVKVQARLQTRSPLQGLDSGRVSVPVTELPVVQTNGTK